MGDSSFADAFVVLADVLSGSGPSGPSSIEVLVGTKLETAKKGEAKLLERKREGAAYVETWEVFVEGRSLGQLVCYDDRRRQRTRGGHMFGSVEVPKTILTVLDDAPEVYIWDESVSR